MFAYQHTIRIGACEGHATKGFRGFSRPRKTNRRRKLIPTGVNLVPLSRAYAKQELKWSPIRRVWSRLRAIYLKRQAA